MNLHPMFQVVPRFLAAMAATGIVVACGARSDLGGYCNLPALAYCRTNGCPLIGPLPTSSFDSWCAGTGAFASSVSGLSTCSSPTQPGISDRRRSRPSQLRSDVQRQLARRSLLRPDRRARRRGAFAESRHGVRVRRRELLLLGNGQGLSSVSGSPALISCSAQGVGRLLGCTGSGGERVVSIGRQHAGTREKPASRGA